MNNKDLGFWSHEAQNSEMVSVPHELLERHLLKFSMAGLLFTKVEGLLKSYDELNALLAAPAAERQEPEAWKCLALKGDDGEHGRYSRIATTKTEMLEFCTHYGGIGAVVAATPLYAKQPAPVAVKLPEFNEWYVSSNAKLTRSQIQFGSTVWLACIERFEKLNN